MRLHVVTLVEDARIDRMRASSCLRDARPTRKVVTMEGDANGTAAEVTELAGVASQQAHGDEAGTQAAGADAQEAAGCQVDASGGTDYEKQLAAKDAKIAELAAQVAEAAKSTKAAEDLSAQIAQLKQQMADERVEFALRSAGARSVKAARALLEEHDGDVAALKEAEPWLFGANLQNDLQAHKTSTTGATGLEPAGVAGGGDGRDLKRWERIAGLSQKKEN